MAVTKLTNLLFSHQWTHKDGVFTHPKNPRCWMGSMKFPEVNKKFAPRTPSPCGCPFPFSDKEGQKTVTNNDFTGQK